MVNRTLQDLMNNTRPFGGKIMILGGDFRQILPVVKRATKQQILSETIKKTSVWNRFKTVRLSKNMRVQNDEDFCKTLISIGNGEVETIENTLPHITFDVVNDMYNDVNKNFFNQAILAPTNSEVDRINEKVIDMMNRHFW